MLFFISFRRSPEHHEDNHCQTTLIRNERGYSDIKSLLSEIHLLFILSLEFHDSELPW